MSRWLRRALADIGTPASVPIAPLAPIGPPAQAIGTIGTNGTGPAMAEDWQAHYEERAAIRQFDGELSKREAIAPLAPIGPPAQAIGTIGTNGTAPPWRRIGRLTTKSAPRSASSTASCRNGKPKLSPSTKRLRLSV